MSKLKMCENPDSLFTICVQNIRSSLWLLANKDLNDINNNDHVNKQITLESARKLRQQLSITQYPPALCDSLLQEISKHHLLTDDLLTQLFASNRISLMFLKLPDARQLSLRGLQSLCKQRIHSIEVHHLTKVTLNDLISCLIPSSVHTLTHLNVSHCALVYESLIVFGLKKLRNLRHLDISHTEFNNFGLEIVVSDLNCLESLNISATKVRDLTPLRKCRNRLKMLSAYNLECTFSDQILLDLVNLQYLDISTEKEPAFYSTGHLFALLQNLEQFPNLKHLDISGQCVLFFDQRLKYLESNSHGLKFLGLMETSLCFSPMFLDGDIRKSCVVTGSADIDQLMNALKAYSHRATFVLRALCFFYDHTSNFRRHPFEPISLVLKAMDNHQINFDIQLAGTACLCNLIKSCDDGDVHPCWLGRVVNAVLCAIEQFPDKTQLLRNSLLTLCSEIILKDAVFDRFRCTKLMMDSLIRHTDIQIRRMAVAISSVLAARISTEEIAYFGSNPEYISTLLSIINNCLFSEENSDNLLKCTLSALWNLTDESPLTCKVFLERRGLDLYNRVLENFTDSIEFQNKVLGLINNIAEVPHLRSELMNEKFLKILNSLAYSSSIHVSYFAVGILCHLAGSYMDPFWRLCDSDLYDNVLEAIATNVLKWNQPCSEMVAYRSFHPFGCLLKCGIPEVQLWALWAINHVCTANPKLYCLKLTEGDFLESIKACCHKYPPQWDVSTCSRNCSIRVKVQNKKQKVKNQEPEVNISSAANCSETNDDSMEVDEQQSLINLVNDYKHMECEFDHDHEQKIKECSSPDSKSDITPTMGNDMIDGISVNDIHHSPTSYQLCTEDHLKQALYFTLHKLSHETLQLVRVHFPYMLNCQ